MEAVEVDVALEELEIRLERLRALYEQYFMGIEKIEPTIARKDVDRRIYVLRREKIRNTAKRFKLQTIIQRYNTFQQYWQRICREIENGTYKRHLLKAQKQQGELLTIAARKRLGRQAITSSSRPPAAASQPPAAPASVPAPASIAPAPAAAPLPAPAPPAAAAAPSPPPTPLRPAPPARPPGTPPLPSRLAAIPPVAAPAPPAAAAPAPVAAAPKSPPAPKPAKYESLDLDMDFMGDWDPGSRGKAGAPTKPATPPARPAALAKPPLLQSSPPPAKAPAASPLPTAPKAAPAANRPASIPPAPVAAPPRPASSRPPIAPAAPARPVARPAPAAPVVRAAPPAKPAPAPPVAAPKPAPAAARPPMASSPGDDDARMRDLHSKLLKAKEQTKEAGVSYEGLAKSIRATEAKLREQHKNRKIDFDVVIKDGKAVVKPIVR